MDELKSEFILFQLPSLIYTFDSDKALEVTNLRSIQKNLSFCGFFGPNDFTLSVVLESGYFMKYEVSIEDLFKL